MDNGGCRVAFATEKEKVQGEGLLKYKQVKDFNDVELIPDVTVVKVTNRKKT